MQDSNLPAVVEHQPYDIPPTSAFIANRLKLNVPLPFLLAPDCVLNKADEEQIEMIKLHLASSVAPNHLDSIISRYECDLEETEMESGNCQLNWNPLLPCDFRYYMVETPDHGQTSRLLHHAASICQVALDLFSLSFHGKYGEGGSGRRPLSLLHYAFYGAEALKEVDLAALQEIGRVFQLLKAATADTGTGERHPKAMKALEMLDQISLLPKFSTFRVLGFFSILELLISHNPTLADKGDSITHQMKTKMPLIMRRFDRQVDLASYFGSCSATKIWEQLYGYRSAIAHGGTPNFTDAKKQRNLKDARTANQFLEEVTIGVIRNYLREPDLYDDLAGV